MLGLPRLEDEGRRRARGVYGKTRDAGVDASEAALAAVCVATPDSRERMFRIVRSAIKICCTGPLIVAITSPR